MPTLKAMKNHDKHYNATERVFRRVFSTFMLVVMLGLAAAPARAVGAPVKIIAFGDSLTAGYGLAAHEAYPAKLEKALKAKGLDVVVVNAGVSGDTAQAGLQRLDWSVGDDARLVIVELGANDALRGIDPAQTRKSLTEIVTRLGKKGAKVLLAGMYAPPNLGEEYGRKFKAIYDDLGKLNHVTLYPFFLDGVAARPELNQADGLHPIAAGYDEIVKRITPFVLKALK